MRTSHPGLLLSALMLVLPTQSLAQEDPCAAAENRFSCIETLINDLGAQIEARLDYLATTKGPQGPKGAAGAKGDTGDQGAPGFDLFSPAYNAIVARHSEMEARFTDKVLLPHLDDVEPALVSLPLELNAVRARLSNVNRNPDIMTQGTITLNKLDFPRDANGDYLESFGIIRDDQQCFYSLDSGIVESCNPLLGDGVEVINPCFHDDPPDYCDNVITSDDTQYVLSGEVTLEGNINEADLPKDPTSYEVVSLHEAGSYKLGMDPNDPIFLLALDRMLNHLDEPEVYNEIVTGVEAAKDKVNAQYGIWLADAQGDADRQQAILEEQQGFIDHVDKTIELINSFTEGGIGQRRLRLAEMTMDSEMMYFYLVQSVSDLFLQYRRCEAVNFVPGIGGCVTNYTQPQLDAFEDFSARLLEFTRMFVRRWQNTAIQHREEFFANYQGSAYASLMSAPDTPDFTATAMAEVGAYYLENQSEEVVGFGEAFAAAGVVAGSVTAIAAGAYVAGAGLGAVPATIAAEIGASTISYNLLVTGTVSWSSVTTGGAIATVAGPAAILTVALVVLIAEGISAGEQAEKDKKYDALIALDLFDDIDNNHTFDDATTANIIYMWLAIDAPRAVPNNPNL